MKFKILPLLVAGHFMVCSNNSKICFIAIHNSHTQTEPIVGEPLPPLLPSQKARKGACDITGRDPKS